MRRQLRGTGRPGTFGGRHHDTYRDELSNTLDEGLIEPAEDLLLGLLDAVEDEVDATGRPFASTYYETLADIYAASDRRFDETAVLERYRTAAARVGAADDAMVERLDGLTAGPAGVAGPGLEPDAVATSGFDPGLGPATDASSTARPGRPVRLVRSSTGLRAVTRTR